VPLPGWAETAPPCPTDGSQVGCHFHHDVVFLQGSRQSFSQLTVIKDEDLRDAQNIESGREPGMIRVPVSSIILFAYQETAVFLKRTTLSSGAGGRAAAAQGPFAARMRSARSG